METIMFAVGVLTMVLVALAALAVYSTVMVLKLKNKIENLTRDLQEVNDHLHRTIDQVHQHFTEKIDKDVDHVNRTIDNVNSDMDRTAGEMIRRIDELNSYVDRRFDKLIDTYILVKETEKESKKLIKG